MCVLVWGGTLLKIFRGSVNVKMTKFIRKEKVAFWPSYPYVCADVIEKNDFESSYRDITNPAFKSGYPMKLLS
jgi:hypothetical protein